MNLIKHVFNMIWLMAKQKIKKKRTHSDKVFKNKAFKIANHPKYDGYRRGLASMVYKFFDKKSALLNKKSASLNKFSGSGANKSANGPNYQLANELHTPIIRKFYKRKGYSFFRDNIWGVD